MAASDNQTALVTGASSGIGEAIAEVLAERQYDLVITARREARLCDLKARLEADHGIRVQVIALDLGVPGGADALYDRVTASGTSIDLLVNNAGFGVYGNSLQVDYERVRQMLELNMIALTTLTHRFGNDMLAGGAGRILQVASIAAFQPSPLYAVYAATKAYVLQMSAAMHGEFAARGVTITTVCPGFTRSGFHAAADHPMPRFMDPIIAPARSVAKAAVKAALAGRAVLTPGLINKLIEFGVRFVPRSWATAMAGLMTRPRSVD